ncbi:MAG TPA: hypothetical protein VF733_02815 [Candidatus Saccharimonadales bacterium]
MAASWDKKSVIPILPEYELLALGGMAVPLTAQAFVEYQDLRGGPSRQ